MQDKLGDQIKGWERNYAPIIPANEGLIVRLDGKNFSRWTESFDKPFDLELNRAFVDTTTALMEEYNPDVGYTQSDEITLIWYPNSEDSNTQHPFGGKTQKLCSVLASHCTVLFDTHVMPNDWALFDARAFGVLSKGNCNSVLAWRGDDAHRNGVTSIAQQFFSDKQLHGVHTNGRIQMLKDVGVDINDYPPHNLHGTLLEFEMKIVELT